VMNWGAWGDWEFWDLWKVLGSYSTSVRIIIAVWFGNGKTCWS
jgi:hypothetical protein